MMIPVEISRIGVRLASFVTVTAGLVLIWLRPAPGTPGFVVSVLTLVLGVCFGVLVWLLARLSQRKSDGYLTEEGIGE